jgi:hypothetical protein
LSDDACLIDGASTKNLPRIIHKCSLSKKRVSLLDHAGDLTCKNIWSNVKMDGADRHAFRACHGKKEILKSGKPECG